MKPEPFASPLGCLTALAFIAVIVGLTYFAGGGMFSPGPLSAQGTGRPPLKGFSSHVQFESRCELCHAPLTGIKATLCEDCHSNISDQRHAGKGVHGVLKNSFDCRLCHVEHKGRQADQSVGAMAAFPHDQTGYSLVKHQAWPNNGKGFAMVGLITRIEAFKHQAWPNNGKAFTCNDCHNANTLGYAFDQSACESCHRKIDPPHPDKHIAKYSADCLACHRELKPFDHPNFPLQLGHADVQCRDCHKQTDFAQTKAGCVTCHEDPAIHAGSFGTDCSACHTINRWMPARLVKHTFPVDHGGKGEIDCVTCHVKSYATYTCYDCHDHDVRQDELKHIKKRIFDSADCMKCHADGRTGEE